MSFDTELTDVGCPYCGERIELVLDPSVAEQEYIEDCAVCCRPIQLSVRWNEQGEPEVEARHENE